MSVGNVGKQYQVIFDDELALIVIKLKKQVILKMQASRSDVQEMTPEK